MKSRSALPAKPHSQTSVSRLSERQQQCLRLVLEGYRSKEIAQQLGISPHTVDDHLRAAIRLLGVTTRMEAARLLSAAALDDPQRLRHQAESIANPPEAAPEASGAEGKGEQGFAAVRQVVQEERAPFGAGPAPRPASIEVRLPLRGSGSDNDLSPLRRAGWVIGLLVAIIIILGVLVIAAEGIGRIVRGVSL